MNLKVGDKIICKKDYLQQHPKNVYLNKFHEIRFNNFTSITFKKGITYIVTYIYQDIIKINYTTFIGDINNYFYTTKEIRKIKLEKLKKNETG